jgi:hypothetical protein
VKHGGRVPLQSTINHLQAVWLHSQQQFTPGGQSGRGVVAWSQGHGSGTHLHWVMSQYQNWVVPSGQVVRGGLSFGWQGPQSFGTHLHIVASQYQFCGVPSAQNVWGASTFGWQGPQSLCIHLHVV